MWKCPECGGTNLCVNVVITAELVQSEKEDLNEGNFETLLVGGDHGWDGDSMMQCKSCNFSNPSCEFDTTFVDQPEEREIRTLCRHDAPYTEEMFVNKADGKAYKAVVPKDESEPCEGCAFMSDGGPVEGCSTSPDCSFLLFVRQP